jgi:hypothetical protein
VKLGGGCDVRLAVKVVWLEKHLAIGILQFLQVDFAYQSPILVI